MTLVDRIQATGAGCRPRGHRLAARTPTASSTSLSATALRELIQLLGSPGFPKQLLVELQALMDVRHLSIIAFDDRLVAHLAVAESLGRVAVAKAAGKIY